MSQAGPVESEPKRPRDKPATGSAAPTLCVCVNRLAHAIDLPLPSYETELAAGMDLAAAVDDTVTLEGGGGQALIPTGFRIALPPGYEAQIRPRSGLAVRHGVSVINAPGTVDADYRGEIKVALINHGQDAFSVTRGMRIAQMVIAPVMRAEIREIPELPDTARGGGGFGSTGL